ncbi:hypothetical protein NC653_034588 [Populus alba x Populus x berolinensis]|uniref:Uncharacterized protein n=1 Tax=Populus alba x Populus x berolinensis TaxID=444605 RepID=A0AAD6LMU9_9ROSI|nr:hypothetical protein NC653_034588 [Populus alba x Populus x berolinensis]
MHLFGMPFAFNLSRLFVYYWIGSLGMPFTVK